ncbi:MAG: maleylpyruvate isomerase N-terminal domain-containing protein [Acidimicrobiia bacterium]
MDEASELLTTLEVTAPTAPTACAGWTAHELVAHLAAGAAEMAALTEDSIAGREPRPTRGLRDREAPFVALPDDELRDRLVTEALRLGAAVASLRAAGPAASVPFSGRSLSAADLDLHGRSEAALHRWDLAGDDAISIELLSQPVLTAHATSVLSSMLDGSPESVASRVDGSGIGAARITFGSPGEPDVVLVRDEDGPRLEMAEPCSEPTATSDPATRLLALWGRRTTIGAIRWNGGASECRDLSRLLGAAAPR